MVELVKRKNEKFQYGFLDRERNQVLNWDKGSSGSSDGYVWSASSSDEAYTIAIGTPYDDENLVYPSSCMDLKTKRRLLELLSRIGSTSGRIPITIDEDFEFEREKDYTDVEVGDACEVPEDLWYSISFSFDDEEDASSSTFSLIFQENTTPWFTGDGHDFPENFQPYIDEYDPSEWVVVDSEQEVSAIIDETFGRIKASLEAAVKKADAKAKKDDSEFIMAVNSIRNESVRGRFAEFAKGNKFKGKKLIELAEFVNSILKKEED